MPLIVFEGQIRLEVNKINFLSSQVETAIIYYLDKKKLATNQINPSGIIFPLGIFFKFVTKKQKIGAVESIKEN